MSAFGGKADIGRNYKPAPLPGRRERLAHPRNIEKGPDTAIPPCLGLPSNTNFHHFRAAANRADTGDPEKERGRRSPINVYGPLRTEHLVKAAVQYFTISAEIRIADGGRTIPIEQLFFGHDVGPGLVYQDANIKVTA